MEIFVMILVIVGIIFFTIIGIECFINYKEKPLWLICNGIISLTIATTLGYVFFNMLL